MTTFTSFIVNVCILDLVAILSGYLWLSFDVFVCFISIRYGQSQVRKNGSRKRRDGSRIDCKPKLTTNDAFSYLKEVKDMFPDQGKTYKMFLVIMNDFRRKRFATRFCLLSCFLISILIYMGLSI